MNPSVSRRNVVKKTQSRSSNIKSESKAEISAEAAQNTLKEDKRKHRSSSLNKQDQIRSKESPKKSQSVDRNVSNRQGTRNISIKNSLVDTKNINITSRKNTISTHTSKNANFNKREDAKSVNVYQTAKSSDKSFRSPMKGPSGKTNLEIAKSFVRNASDSKTKKVINKSSKKSSGKLKSDTSHIKALEERERPRTSTIRKSVSEISKFTAEENKSETVENDKNLHFEEPALKVNDLKSNHGDDDDDKLSYEEDFEDYDSDFEESDSESVSYSDSADSVNEEEENVLDSGIDRISVTENPSSFSNDETINCLKHQSLEIKKTNEKTFLQMSDRSFLTSNKTTETSNKSLIKPSHSFINFASAVEEEKKEKCSNKILKRSSELLEMVEMSDVAFNQIDIPPMKYDTFMRFFGKNDYKQVFVQTENVEDEAVETDEIEMLNKWTQNPPHDNFGYGGDIASHNVQEDENLKSLYNSQNVKLSSFVQNCSKVILTLLDEEFPVSSQVQATQRRNELFYSDGYYILSSLSFLKDAPVLNVYGNSECSHYILTIYDGIIQVPQTKDERGVICVWNIFDHQNPEQILVAHSQPTCTTFGPCGNDIIIAGMVDGSVLLWDLADHHSQKGTDDTFKVKAPTYSTAVVLGKENHRSHIVAIQALINYSKDESASANFSRTNLSKNFHVLTLEDMGILNIWVVVEVLKPDLSGVDTDLGLAPGGKLRLVRSSSLYLYELSALQDLQKINIRTFDFRLVPFDSNRILITTDAGIVLHVNRQGGAADPRFYSNDLDFSSEVRCIDCSPHNEDLFLVGCSDGRAMLYNIKLVRPIKVFLLAARGDPVTLLQWSPIHPSMFLVLSSSSSLYLWNLMEDSLHPINCYHFPDIKITWFTFYNLVNSKSQKSSEKILHMFVSRDDGMTEVHVFKHNVSKEEYSKQVEFMKKL